MATKLIAQKQWKNAVAFIEVDENSGEVWVYGKFYEDDSCRRRGFPGPKTPVLAVMPEEILQETHSLSSYLSPKSQDLSDFIERIWLQAKNAEPWFDY